jgi:hypothetical protein
LQHFAVASFYRGEEAAIAVHDDNTEGIVIFNKFLQRLERRVDDYRKALLYRSSIIHSPRRGICRRTNKETSEWALAARNRCLGVFPSLLH